MNQRVEKLKTYFFLFLICLFSFIGCKDSASINESSNQPVYNVSILNISSNNRLVFTLEVFAEKEEVVENVDLTFEDTTFIKKEIDPYKLTITGYVSWSQLDAFEDKSLTVTSPGKNSTYSFNTNDFAEPLLEEVTPDTLIEDMPLFFIDSPTTIKWQAVEGADYYILHLSYAIDRRERPIYKQHFITGTSFEAPPPNTLGSTVGNVSFYVEAIKGPFPSIIEKNGTGQLPVTYRLKNRSAPFVYFFITRNS